ncbi:MAG: hypothetical protein J6S21_06630, partial [Victivallales bacterium]|nr:hypothetical protein [Victivallales bacterium]
MSLNITPGVHWHGGWEAGRVEGNRQLYDYELVFFSAGRGRIVFPECTFHCVEGSVAIVPPGSVHCTIADEPVHRWCIHFDWRGEWQGSSGGSLPFVYLDSRRHFNASEAALPPPPELQMTFPFFLELRDEELEHFRGRVQEYFDDGRENLAGALNRKGLLLQLLSMLVHSESRLPKSADNRHFLRAKSFLDSNYALPSIGLQETAAAVNVTPN